MTKSNKRKTITMYDYKNRPTNIPIPKDTWWWCLRTGTKLGTLHCVVSCYNIASVVYITDYGLARIAYCDSHACERIMNTMLTGNLERGVWCIANNGKLKQHWYYERYMNIMKQNHPKQAKKLLEKLKTIRSLK